MLCDKVRRIAHELNIDAIGFIKSRKVSSEVCASYTSWIEEGNNASMDYLVKYAPEREDPSRLLPEVKSIITIAVNYYPPRVQQPQAPKIAKYALGRDYHKVIKKLLLSLAERINTEVAPHSYKALVDTAPFMERYWAKESGLGFIGRNTNLIVPKIGSYVFLGALLTSLELSEDSVTLGTCGKCRRCIESCPTKALTDKGLDARRCINYLTIEHKGDIPKSLSDCFGKRLYGCDTCQDVCPYNKAPLGSHHFEPSPQLIQLTDDDIENLDEDQYARLFYGSASTRAKLEGMQRNARIYLHNNKES